MAHLLITYSEDDMATGKITKQSVEAMPPGYLWDPTLVGFGARRQTTSGIFYVVRYRRNGKQRIMSIGRHGRLTPDEARSRAKVLLGKIEGGADPLAEKDRPAPETLRPVIDRYLARREPGMRPRSFVEITRHLRKHSAPLHSLGLGEVDRKTVAQLLGKIEEDSGPMERNRVRASLSKLWNWLIAEGLAEVNVISATAEAEERSRERVLDVKELAIVLRNLGNDAFGDLVRLLVLTGQRRSELGALRWSEVVGFETEGATSFRREPAIILGPERTKNGRRHEVPLSPSRCDPQPTGSEARA
jgi:integrase